MNNDYFIGSFHVNSTNASQLTLLDLLDICTVCARVFEMNTLKILDGYSYRLLRYGPFCDPW